MDKSCQLDLVKDNGHSYFVSVLSSSPSAFSSSTSSPPSYSANSSNAAHFITSDSESLADDQTLSAFVLAVICDNCRPGQIACLGCGLLPLCLSLIPDAHPLLRCWLVFCLGKLWEDFEDAKVVAIREGAHEKLCALLTDSSTEVRAAAVFSIGTFLANAGTSEARKNIELNIGLTLPVVTGDASPLVRKELVISLHYLVEGFKDRFQEAVTELYEDDTFRRQDSRSKPKRSPAPPSDKSDGGGRQLGSVYDCIWKVLVSIRTDPFPEVAQLANSIANELMKSAGMGPLNTSGSTGSLSASSSGVGADPASGGSWKAKTASTTAQRGRRNILGSLSVRLEKEEEEAAPASDPFQQIADETRLGAQAALSLFRRIGSEAPASGPPPSSSSSSSFSSASSQPSTPLRNQDLESSPVQDRAHGSESTAAGHVELRSSLFNWSCGRFSAPLLRPLEEDSTSPSFLRKLWRNKRRKDVLAEVTKSARTGYRRMDDQIAILDNNIEHTSHLAFHPFDDVLITCNLFDQVGVWSWKEGVSGVRTAFFSNNNAPGSLLTGIQLINDHDQPLIMISSSDGVVRIWEHPSVSNPADPTTYVTGGKMNSTIASSTPYQFVPPKLVTSFKALIDLPSNVKVIGSNLVIDWQQDNGVLAISGDVSIIRVWNLERELHFQDISASPDACVSCLTNDNPSGRTIIAGYEDGFIRLFDQRSSASRYSAGISFQEEKSRILRIHRSKLDVNVAVSGSLDGVIKIWDLRRTAQSVKSIDCLKGQASAYAVHDYLPLIAVGSQSQKIKVFNFDGELLSLMRYHDGFLGQRIGPISCLNFHPFKPYLGAGARDSIVSIYRGATSL
jgi:regulator-associated protein of mTOR